MLNRGCATRRLMLGLYASKHWRFAINRLMEWAKLWQLQIAIPKSSAFHIFNPQWTVCESVQQVTLCRWCTVVSSISKYDGPEVENVARGRSPNATFSTSGPSYLIVVWPTMSCFADWSKWSHVTLIIWSTVPRYCRPCAIIMTNGHVTICHYNDTQWRDVH